MKYLMVMLLAVSCGKYQSSGDQTLTLGQNETFEPRQITGADLIRKEEICRSIIEKTDKMVVMNGQQFSFTMSQKNCAGETSQSESMNVTLQVNNDSIFFMRESGQFFVFKDAETMRSGIMRSFCSSTQNPFMHNGVATWWDSNLQNVCTTQSQNRRCVTFKYGLQDTTSNVYRIRTVESLLINTDTSSPRYGFYQERTIVSDTSCENGAQTMIRATLN